MFEIPEVSDAEMAFGIELSKMPTWEDIPEEFKKSSGNIWCDFAERVFFSGGSFKGFTPKKDADVTKAIRFFRANLCSFSSQHEHKVATAGYILSLTYEEPKE